MRMTVHPDAQARLAALGRRARDELALMSYPNHAWVRPPRGVQGPVTDVLIIGGGQSGIAAWLALWREGVTNVRVVDRAEAGFEGPWETYARMRTLRTPKASIGLESGLPALTARAWSAARHGEAAWEAFERVPRHDWMDYLRWLRATVGAPIENRVAAGALSDGGDGLVAVPLTGLDDGVTRTVRARHVVLATGFDGAGRWQIPPHIEAAVPPAQRTHSNLPFDLGRGAGKRVGILGHGASAFDTAGALLAAGAASVDVCYRRRDIPTINPHRPLENAGLLRHYGELPASLRWEIAHFFDTRDQPPTQLAWDIATAYPACRVHAACPWDLLRMEGDEIVVETPRGRFRFDFIVCATGAALDLAARPELSACADGVARWREHYTPPAHLTHATLAEYPWLGPAYEFTPRREDEAWLARVHAFNYAAYVSHGPHSTSVSAQKFSMPRLVRGITGALFDAQRDAVMPEIAAYADPELRLPEPRAAA